MATSWDTLDKQKLFKIFISFILRCKFYTFSYSLSTLVSIKKPTELSKTYLKVSFKYKTFWTKPTFG